MTGLVDHLGRPLARRDLDREIARPRVGSVRPPIPATLIAGLSPQALAFMMESARMGEPGEMLELAKTMELRWPHYRGQLATRKLAVLGLPRTVVAPTDSSEDISLAEELNAVLTSDAADAGVAGMLDALSKGYSLVEVVWNKKKAPWTPSRFLWRDPQHFVFERETFEEARLKTDAAPIEGEVLEPGKWIAHCPRLVMGLPIEGSLAWACAAFYVIASMGLRDWVTFVEVFGMPVRLGRVPPGSTEAARDELLAQLALIGTDACAVISADQDINFIDRGRVPGAKDLFIGFLDWLNKQVSKVIVGQTSSAEGGTSLAHATQQEEVRQDILRADADQIAKTWTRDVCRPYTGYNRGEDTAPSRARFIVEDAEDLEAFSNALVPFIEAGLKVESSEIRDKFQLSTPEDGAEVIGEQAADLAARARHDEGAARRAARLAALGARRSARGRAVLQRVQSERLVAYARREGLHVHGRVLFERATRSFVQVPRARASQHPATTASAGQRLPAPSQRRRPGADSIEPAERAETDLIDELTDEATSSWRDAMGPIFDVLAAEAEAAEDADDFLERLEDALTPEDFEAMIRTIGVNGLKARGLGDAVDHPGGVEED